MDNVFLRFPGGRKRALTLSYDDGVEQDIELIELMKTYGLKGTFNLNSGLYAPAGTTYAPGTIHRRLTKDAVTSLYKSSGMEIAVHTFQHPQLELLSSAECAWQVVKDKEALEEQFGCIVRGMAYPYGTYNDQVVDTLHACGIAYCRTVSPSNGFALPTDWLRLKPTCHHAHPELMRLAHRFIEEDVPRSPALFYLWGHSYEFEQDNNWQIIRDFAAFIGNRDEVWYATNLEIYDYMQAYRGLISSANGKLLHNPTATTLCMQARGQLFTLAPGETMAL